MAFRLGHDELQHELPWRLMQNGSVTKYLLSEYLEADVAELVRHGFIVRRFDCSKWPDDKALHRALREGLSVPDYTGANFNALADAMTEADVPEVGGLALVLDGFDGSRQRDEMLLRVLADSARRWLLFGRLQPVLLSVGDPRYEGPSDLAATSPRWNAREWLNRNRGSDLGRR